VTPYKRLRDVVFIEAIPVSAAGKVLKRELAAKEREKVRGTA
jgi:long-chain acyl-CoA synthetase